MTYDVQIKSADDMRNLIHRYEVWKVEVLLERVRKIQRSLIKKSGPYKPQGRRKRPIRYK